MLLKRSPQVLPVLPMPVSAGRGARASSPHAAVACQADHRPGSTGCRSGSRSEPDCATGRSGTDSQRDSVKSTCATCRSCCRK